MRVRPWTETHNRPVTCLAVVNRNEIKGLRPLPPTPADSRIFGFFDFSKNVDFGDFPVGFGVKKVCNGLEMAVGFKWTDSQPISSILSSFPSMFMISGILMSILVV